MTDHRYPPGFDTPAPIMGTERIGYEITYGHWEDPPDAPRGAYQHRNLWPLQRKRFEMWRDENGVKWGRWEWDIT